METVEMDVTLKYCVELLRYRAEGKQQQILLHTVPVSLKADREKIWRVMINLMTNAIKATQAGGRIDLEVSETPQGIVFSVSDNGGDQPDLSRNSGTEGLAQHY